MCRRSRAPLSMSPSICSIPLTSASQQQISRTIIILWNANVDTATDMRPGVVRLSRLAHLLMTGIPAERRFESVFPVLAPVLKPLSDVYLPLIVTPNVLRIHHSESAHIVADAPGRRPFAIRRTTLAQGSFIVMSHNVLQETLRRAVSPGGWSH